MVREHSFKCYVSRFHLCVVLTVFSHQMHHYSCSHRWLPFWTRHLDNNNILRTKQLLNKSRIMNRLILIFVFATQICLGQEIKIDSCGIDNSIGLNQYEVQYFNQVLENQRKRSDFDFSGKLIGFTYGNFGKGLHSKREYFDKWGKEYFRKNSNVSNQLFVLTEEEKYNSGGYDAIIVSWSKIMLSSKDKNKIIRKLKEKTAANPLE